MKLTPFLLGVCLVPLFASAQSASQIEETLLKAVRFYHEEVANHGGYVYTYSSDLTLREAEGYPDLDTIWIQPPGTPAVGEAFMDAYEATRNPLCSQAALDAARALVLTQLQSGGWYYRGLFDPDERKDFAYYLDLELNPQPEVVPESQQTAKGGWALWRQRSFGPANLTTLDDDVTQAALRLLIRVDAALKFKDPSIHQAALRGLEALMGVQYPNGGWSANFDRFPADPTPDAEQYPVVKANYPADWPKTWPKDFTGCYVTNDNLQANCVSTLIRAWETYQEPKYLDALKRAGEFLLLAQMPDPQPAWAQQYNAEMQPVWDRAFEPTAISGRESQRLVWTLFDLYRATEDGRYLESASRAIAYLDSSLMADGTLSRFYELETNKPLFFTRGPGGQGHVMSYERERLASNYGWIIDSELDLLSKQLSLLKAQGVGAPQLRPEPEVSLKEIVEGLDARGAWTEEGMVRDSEGRKQSPEGGIIQSLTFVRNVGILCEALKK